MVSFGGNSRRSLATLRKELDQVLAGVDAKSASELSTEFFFVLRTLDSSIGLRRALTDPAREASSKVSLARDLFGSSIKSKAMAIVESAVALKWSTPSEFADCLEQIAVEAEATAANIENQIDQVQSELFNFSRTLSDSYELRQALSDSRASDEVRSAIVKDIFGTIYSSFTLNLIVAAVSSRAHRSIDKGLEAIVAGVTARRNRVNALVRSSIALTSAQSERLAANLSKMIGQPVHLNFEIDQKLIGGVSVQFAEEIIDGTIATRLDDARRVVSA